MSEHHSVSFMDHGRQPQCEYSRADWWGKDIDGSDGKPQTCTVDLDWPALRCGVWRVTCRKCGLTIGVTAAGRVDDPRSLKMGCKL